MSVVNLIVGLPASGKSFLGDKLVHNLWYEDWNKQIWGKDFDKFSADKRYRDLVRYLKGDNTITIDSILFCDPEFREQAINELKSIIPTVTVNIFYFENNFEQCIKNAILRDHHERGGYFRQTKTKGLMYFGLHRHNTTPLIQTEIDKIKNLALKYTIPPDGVILKVFPMEGELPKEYVERFLKL